MIAPLREKMFIGENMSRAWMMFFSGLSANLSVSDQGKKTVIVNSRQTLTKDASTIICTNAANTTVTLPVASTMTDSSIAIFAAGNGNVTIKSIPPDDIDGGESFTIYKYEQISAKSVGTGWLLF